MELPQKSQLAILTLARLSEPLTQTSLQAYMFYQLKSFPTPSGDVPSDALVARQAGLLAAGFTGAQFLTAMLWGRAADSELMGRKRVILTGLLGTAMGSLGFGFSRSFGEAMAWRMVGGVLNGNIGVMRTMISEIVREKRWQSRAFLLMPMTFNIGVIIGPLLGGLLADPVGQYPGLFGPGGKFGGEEGVWLFREYPWALPNLVNAGFLSVSATALALGLDETLEGLRGRKDWGRKVGMMIGRLFKRTRGSTLGYTAIPHHEDEAGDENHLESNAAAGPVQDTKAKARRRLPFRRIFTTNVLSVLLSHGLLAAHVGTFSNLWFIFLSTPRYSPDADESLSLPPDYTPHLPFTFTGGLALPPPAIGTALAILGGIGISLQLLVYPRISFLLGTIRSFHLSLLLFPITYFLAPYLAALPSSSPPPHPASGPLIWVGITLVLAIQVLARTFALPSTTILVNNASPHPSVLGTVHGIAQSVSSAARTLGPVLAGYIYGVGLESGTVGLAWWWMACVSMVGAVAGRWVKEGDGHEIWLEGEREEEEEEEEERSKSQR
jgi:MFS family permease